MSKARLVAALKGWTMSFVWLKSSLNGGSNSSVASMAAQLSVKTPHSKRCCGEQELQCSAAELLIARKEPSSAEPASRATHASTPFNNRTMMLVSRHAMTAAAARSWLTSVAGRVAAGAVCPPRLACAYSVGLSRAPGQFAEDFRLVSTAAAADRAAGSGTLLTKVATLSPKSKRKRGRPRAKTDASRDLRHSSSHFPSLEELEAAVEAVEENPRETELLALILQEWSRRQLLGAGAGSDMISLTVRAYTAAGAHHMALALFEATKSEKLTAHAYGALLQVRRRCRC